MAGTTGVAGARELAASLTAAAARTTALIEAVVAKSAHDLVALTQRNASGRPGPNAPTGDYRGSWTAQPEPSPPGAVSWSAGTDRAQANRLEYGFVGTDSLGRTFDQQPYPHMGPAADAVEPEFLAAMTRVAEQALSW